MTQKVLMNKAEKAVCIGVLSILLLSTILAISLVGLLKERYLIPVIMIISPFILQYVSVAFYLWYDQPRLGGKGSGN